MFSPLFENFRPKVYSILLGDHHSQEHLEDLQ